MGAEGLSQSLDKGSSASTSDRVGAGLEIASVLPGVKIVGEAAPAIKGMTGHAVDQAINRGIKPAQILDAIKNTLKTTAVKIDNLGRPSYKAIGEKVTLAVNPETKKIVTMNPTSTKLAEKLKKPGE